jgi:nitrite reductase/ring-hydroxylating ferredoxin subunit
VKIVVARLDEFPPGERRIVEAGRRSIGVFRVGDNFYAINNYCPHQGGPLCLGHTLPWVSSQRPGEYVMAEQDALLACPWHGWEYDLATGQSFLGPGEPPVLRRQARHDVAGQRVRVDVGVDDRVPGPVRAGRSRAGRSRAGRSRAGR